MESVLFLKASGELFTDNEEADSSVWTSFDLVCRLFYVVNRPSLNVCGAKSSPSLPLSNIVPRCMTAAMNL
jgi:hypothetical protein